MKPWAPLLLVSLMSFDGCAARTDSQRAVVSADTVRLAGARPTQDSIQAQSSEVVRTDTAVRSPGLEMALVDLADKPDPEDDVFARYRVQVKYAGRTDTIPTVLTNRLPVASEDGKLYMFGFAEGGFLDEGYSYDLRTRALAEFKPPPGSTALETHILISPDARHIAYIATNGANGTAVVRSWPDAELVAQGPGAPWCQGDEDYNSVRWLDTRTAELAYCSGGSSKRVWVHTIVDVSNRQIKVDTLASRPAWNP